MTAAPPPPVPEYRWADHARRVSGVQWLLLAGFVVLGLAGLAVYAYAHFDRPVYAVPQDRTAGRASGFVDGHAPGMLDVPGKTTDTWAGWGGASATALGFSFAGGFVLGFVCRAFVKLATLLLVVLAGGAAALAYFGIVDIDFGAARNAYDANASWIGEQATRVKDVLLTHLPSYGGGTAGLFAGLRRK